MKLVENTKLFVDMTNIMVVHIMNNEIGCFNKFVLREWQVILKVWNSRLSGHLFPKV